MPLSTRILRGGATRAILYREDTGDVVDVRAALMPARNGSGLLAVERDRVVTAAGTRREQGRSRQLPLMISDRGVIEQLEGWGDEPVRAAVFGFASGVHRLWDHPVRMELDESDAAFGAFGGYVVRLYTAAFSAPVHLSDDLLTGATELDDDPLILSRLLPAAGLWVVAVAPDGEGMVVRAYDFTDTLIVEEDHDYLALMQLPANTWRVEVERDAAATGSGLFVAPPSLTPGGYLLIEET